MSARDAFPSPALPFRENSPLSQIDSPTPGDDEPIHEEEVEAGDSSFVPDDATTTLASSTS